MIKIKIEENDKDQRLDRFLRKYYKNAPLGYIYKLLRTKIKVNGLKADKSMRLSLGDEIIIDISPEEERDFFVKERPGAVKRDFTVSYEDNNVLIVEKPVGILTHGGSDEKRETLTNQVIGYLIDKGDYDTEEKVFIPAPVTRLDRNTGGLVIFGKNAASLRSLSQMTRERNYIRRSYLAMVHGEMNKEMLLRGYMSKNRKENVVRIAKEEERSGGKYMETRVMPMKVFKGFTLVEAELVTGRTHQIRAQLADEGYPIIGDPKYGDSKADYGLKIIFPLRSQYLQAWKILFMDCLPPLEYMKNKEVVSILPSWAVKA